MTKLLVFFLFCSFEIFNFARSLIYRYFAKIKLLSKIIYQANRFIINYRQSMKFVEPKPDRKSLPSRGLNSNTAVWMDEKKTRDAELLKMDSSNYWIVENKYYDLSDFVDKHPGGSRWLTLTKGQDVTDLFIIHHLNQKSARQVLNKYYVGQNQTKIQRYSYEQNGFYRTVKRRLLQRMSLQEIQSETKSKIYAIIILSLFLIFLGITAASINLENPTNMTYLYAAITAFFLIGILGIGHNFVHHKDSIFKYFFVLTGFTHNEWQIMHAISHHVYPNTQLDYEAAALEPIGFFLANKPENKIYTQPLLIFLIFFLQPTNFLLKVIVVPLIKKKAPEFWYAVPLLVFCLFYLVCGDIMYSLKLHLFLYGVFGLLFNRVIFCGHRVGQLWTEGNQRIQDYGEHTIYSTADTDTWITGFWSYFFLAGLNIHTPHHLFPTADLAVLPQILKIVDQVCQEKGIKQTKNTRLSCFKSLSKNIVKRSQFTKK